MRRSDAPAEVAEDLSEHYRRDAWAFSTPLCDVYNGHDLRLPRDVQLRFFTPRVMREPTVASGVLAAARQAAGFVHPNLTAVYDIGMIGGRRCVVTEATGQRLADRPDPLTSDEAQAVARDCVEGLRVAHAAGLVHGDIGPDAVVFGHDGTAKIADVGLFAAAAAADTSFRPRTPTAATPLSPEADLLALATTLRQRGADDAARWVASQAAREQGGSTQAIPPAPSPVMPASSTPTGTATTPTIPTRPVDEPAVEPAPTSAPAPKTTRARPRVPTAALRQLAPLLVTAAVVLALLVVAFNDAPPPIPGLPTGPANHHTGLPPQIPQ